MSAASPGTVARCVRCNRVLERTAGRSLEAALALSATTLLLLAPANLFLFLRTEALGVSRSSRLASSAEIMLRDGLPLLALVVLLFVVIFPILRFGLLTVVLATLRNGRRPAWIGGAFRAACQLETWAMADVFLLGLAVAYARLSTTVSTVAGPGCLCLVASALTGLLVRATLDKARVWELIVPSCEVEGRAATCLVCDQAAPVADVGRQCPRCGAVLRRRKSDSVARAVALTLATLILYVPANVYPLATLPINLKPTTYTVLEGVLDLAHADLWDLAALVFTASFAIPFLKLAGISWCVASVLTRSRTRLRAKTRVYRVVEEIGRWSMVDPFVIGCFVPVMDYNAIIYGRAGPATVPFTAVVVLTIVSARAFDPRLMWDAAGKEG